MKQNGNPVRFFPEVWKSQTMLFQHALNIAKGRLRTFFAAKNVDERHVLVVLALSQKTTCNQKFLAYSMNISDNAMVKLIDEMEAHQYLRRVHNVEDRREYHLELKTKGKKLAEWCLTFYEQVTTEIFRPLTFEEVLQIRALSNKIIDHHYDVGGGQKSKGRSQVNESGQVW